MLILVHDSKYWFGILPAACTTLKSFHFHFLTASLSYYGAACDLLELNRI